MINLAKQINNSIKETNQAKEYFALKEQLSKDEYINSLLKVIEQTQKEVKEALANKDMNLYKVKVATLETLKEEFINHPLVNNYIVSKEEFYSFLSQIVNIISE